LTESCPVSRNSRAGIATDRHLTLLNLDDRSV